MTGTGRRGVSSGLPRVPATFAPTARAREALAALPTVAVLRAPRGFGKSSTAAQWLRRPDLPDRDVVWVSLPPRGLAGPAFWHAVDLALERAGLESAAAVGWDGLAMRARERRRRLVLVVDGLDRVEDRRVDDELVALVQAHAELHLVLLMRAQRPVEALARVAADTVVLTREHLALDAPAVADLARRTGRAVRPEEARWLAAELGGWPGLLRAALLTAGRGPEDELVLDTASLADYVRLVLQDDELAAVAEDLTALAVPERITAEVAAHLVGRHVLPGALARAQAAGLVAGEGPLAFPTVVRDLLRRILREDCPARYRELNRTMMEHRGRAGDALAALRHAVRTQEPDAVLGVVEDGWAALVAHPTEVRAALAEVPVDLLARSAKGLVALEHLRPAQVPPAFLLALVSGLRPGVPWQDDPVGAPAPADVGEVPELLVQLGTRLLLDADVLRATHAFADAAVRAGADGATAAPARAGAALGLVLLGHTDAARRFLPGEGGDAPGDALTALATRVGPALLALDALVAPAPPDPNVDLPAPLAALEGLALYVRATAAVPAGEGAGLVGELERFRHGPAGQAPLAAGLALAALADLHLAHGRGDRARALFTGAATPPDRPFVGAARARVALYAGEHELALRLSARAPELAAVCPRPAVELSLVRAVAAHRTGRPHVAGEALDLATSLAESTGILRPFLLVPRADLDQLATTLPRARALLARPELTVRGETMPTPNRPVNLSRSELRVLVELSSGRPVTHVARRLFVSESTVKTQVRSIYRKLDVHSRAEALGRARALGILPPA
ncbi:LuxR C-terminal-related transcriptional regulator [Georgenia ruanii]|uniref:LuxR C-terminal-related transcriptional regulator n=1 Tax=Georgenia ruanii TaxID=348442 RepID=UPI001264B236|nr:LuxR C-terminal-related transcriptional regulator [Georgenia ruanii]